MTQQDTETRKYIVGWLTFPPGNRDRFMALVPAYVQACLSEPGCLFFEANPSISDPDVLTITECFVSEAAHATHLQTEYFRVIWEELHSFALSGRFENVFPSKVIVDTAQFRPV